MKIKFNVLSYAFFFLFASFSFAQDVNKKIALADKNYENYFYVDAIKIYLELANEGNLDEKGLKKLANCYYFNSDYSNAIIWYESIFNKIPLQNSEYCYRYGQCLKSAGDYVKANKVMDQFVELANQELRAKLIRNNKDYLEKIKENSDRYDIANLDINSSFPDFGTSFWGNKFVFTSSRNFGKKNKDNSKRDNVPYSSLLISDIDDDGDFSEPVLLFDKKKNTTDFNESTATFTKDGKTMYFTRNGIVNKKSKKAAILTLKIFKATFNNGQWSKPAELPFNSNNYNVSHPALSPKEDKLYFVSDMPGTLGDSDIFYVNIDENGQYSEPIHLGAPINTEGKESYPFVSQDNEFYFSSDGHPGLGGLDVFVAKINENKMYDNIENVGAPVNTGQDDFAYSIDDVSRKGYFTSNRSKGKGGDDIYWFLEKQKVYCYSASGIIVDKFTDLPVEGVVISLLDDHFKVLSKTMTDAKGNFTLKGIPYNKKVYIRREKEDFLTEEVGIDTKESRNSDDLDNKSNLSYYMERKITPLSNGYDLAKLLDIGNLYFEYEQAAITEDASLQLKKILKLMQMYPEVKIHIKTYTDSRGTVQFNLKLSEKRYRSVIEWLKNKGIASYRLSGQGFGESQLVNHCTDGIDCSMEEHELNRRCEFIFSKDVGN